MWLLGIVASAILMTADMPPRMPVSYPLRDPGAMIDSPFAVWRARIAAFRRDLHTQFPRYDKGPRYLGESHHSRNDFPESIEPVSPGWINYWKEIGEDGRVRRMYVTNSDQPKALDWYFAQEARYERWSPATLGGKPVACVIASGSLVWQPTEKALRRRLGSVLRFWNDQREVIIAWLQLALGLIVAVSVLWFRRRRA